MNMKLLCTRMPSFQKYQIRACLNELEREGKVYFSKESGYALCSRLGIVSGTVVKVAGKFGFAQLDDEEGTQVFIPGRFLMGAMAGEKVLLKTRPSRTGQSLEGEVLQCIPLTEISYASNTRNSDTVAIEVCHPDETGKFSAVTYDRVVELTAWLCRSSG